MRWLRNTICKLTCKLPGIGGYSLWGVLNHPLDAFILYYYRKVKWFIQRGHRGFADCDNWSIDYYLNSWLPKALRNLKDGHGYPMDVYARMFPEDDWTQSDPVKSTLAHAKWHEILETMAMGFEAAQKINEYEFKGPEELTVLQDQLNEGLRLFREYYQNLWD